MEEPNRPDDHSHALAVLAFQHEHFLKLLDLFETRQTWAFNFAMLVYTTAFAIFGVLIDKMYKPEHGWQPESHMLAAGAVVLSIALPILMLPLCFLYCDVSVFCAALTEGNVPFINKSFQALDINTPHYVPPGVLAFRWLRRRPNKLSIEWVANLRVTLFYIAPLSGIVASGYILFRGFAYGTVFHETFLHNTAVTGLLISAGALAATFLACAKTLKARKLAHPSEP